MKGSAAIPPNYNNRDDINEENYQQPQYQQPQYQQPQNQDENLLSSLGFEEGELEMFFESQFTEDELVNKYLEIARSLPYNLNWQTREDASNPDEYMLGVFKSNGVEYTKHDIANDALNFFYEKQEEEQRGGKRKSKRTTKKRRGMKKKKRNTRKRDSKANRRYKKH